MTCNKYCVHAKAWHYAMQYFVEYDNLQTILTKRYQSVLQKRCEVVYETPEELAGQIEELWTALKHAKKQRDRAILKVNMLGLHGWYPDQDGPYGE